mmetsp:Transcript_5226/g.11655  ORF Transcript_5226/g.11655 Transcript_5226/m.11655 type:complete len:210 (-) Transcript_5226:202-831(-)
MACLVQPSREQSFFFAPCAMHLPPWTATLVHPFASQRFRAGPCLLHLPATFTFFLQPGYEQGLRFAPCEIHSPPCTTRFGHPSTEHFLRIRLLVPPCAKARPDGWSLLTTGLVLVMVGLVVLLLLALVLLLVLSLVLSLTGLLLLFDGGLKLAWRLGFGSFRLCRKISPASSSSCKNETDADDEVDLWCPPDGCSGSSNAELIRVPRLE